MGETVTQSAVGIFFIISGYLFYAKQETFTRAAFRSKLKRRINTLAVPYIAWNAIAILLFVAFHLLMHRQFGMADLAGSFWCSSQWDADTYNILGWRTPMYGPMDLPLWYLRDLIVQVLLAALTYRLVRHLKIFYILALTACFLTKIWIWLPGFSINAFLFWALGAHLALNKKEFGITVNNKHLKYLLFAASLLLVVYVSLQAANEAGTHSYIIRQAGVLAGIYIFMAAARHAARTISATAMERTNRLNKSVFFVYAIHSICGFGFTQIAIKLAYPLMEKSNVFCFMLCYLAAPFAIYAMSVLAHGALKRATPRLAAVLNGGR